MSEILTYPRSEPPLRRAKYCMKRCRIFWKRFAIFTVAGLAFAGALVLLGKVIAVEEIVRYLLEAVSNSGADSVIEGGTEL